MLTIKDVELDYKQFSLKHSSAERLQRWYEESLCGKHPVSKAKHRLSKESYSPV